MAVSRVKGITVDSTGTSVAFASFTATNAADLLTCASKAGATGNTLGCSDGVNTWNGIDIANTLDGGNELGSFYAANCSGSAITVTITCTVSGHSMRGVLDEFSGVATSNPLNDHGTNGNTGANSSGSVTTLSTTTASGDLVVGFTTINSPETSNTPGSSYTQGSILLNGRIASQWKAATAGGSQTADYSWLSTNASYMASIATFTAAGAATFIATKSVFGLEAVNRANNY